MPYPALGPVRGSSAYRSRAVRRVTGSGPGKMTGVTVVYPVQHGEKEPGPGDRGLTGLGRTGWAGFRLVLEQGGGATRPPGAPARRGRRGRCGGPRRGS